MKREDDGSRPPASFSMSLRQAIPRRGCSQAEPDSVSQGAVIAARCRIVPSRLLTADLSYLAHSFQLVIAPQVNFSLSADSHLDYGSSEQERCTTCNGRSPHFGLSGCSTKNSHITVLALISRVVRPANHSVKGLPPGQVWPPPSTV